MAMDQRQYFDENDSPIQLTELEPSPVDETPSYFPSSTSPTSTSTSKASQSTSYFPPPLRSNTVTTLGLDPRTGSWPQILRQTQKYSSITFTIFAAFHITNVAILPLTTRSVQDSSKYLLLTRPYYQSFPLEPLIIIIPLALHVSSGMLLRLHHRRVLLRKSGAASSQDRRQIPWPKISGTSMLGYAAVPLVLGHSALTRMLPLWIEGGSSSIGLDFVGHGVAIAPVVGHAGFAALVAVVGSHVVWGLSRWAGLSPENVGRGQVVQVKARERRKRRWIVNAVAGLVVGVWAAGGIGVVARGGRSSGWVGKIYDDLYRHVPVLGAYV